MTDRDKLEQEQVRLMARTDGWKVVSAFIVKQIDDNTRRLINCGSCDTTSIADHQATIRAYNRLLNIVLKAQESIGSI